MKELTKLVLESGLVNKSTAVLMERWGQLEPGSVELIDKRKLVAERFLQDFVEDLELLLQPEALEREVIILTQTASSENRT